MKINYYNIKIACLPLSWIIPKLNCYVLYNHLTFPAQFFLISFNFNFFYHVFHVYIHVLILFIILFTPFIFLQLNLRFFFHTWILIILKRNNIANIHNTLLEIWYKCFYILLLLSMIRYYYFKYFYK